MIKDMLNTIIGYRDSKGLMVVIDSKVLKYNGKTIYTSLIKKVPCFYIKTPKGHKEILSNLEGVIDAKLKSNLFNGLKIDFKFNEAYDKEGISIKTNMLLNTIFIESVVYARVKQEVKSRNDNHNNMRGNTLIVFKNGYCCDRETTDALIIAFEDYSLKAYRDVVYDNRIYRKLITRNKFYGIQKSFVPVLVEIPGLYNPLLENSKLFYKNTLFYKIGKNRVIDVDSNITKDSVSAHMLTHKEICEGLNLMQFMRFTGEDFYNVYIGLVGVNSPDFPSINRYSYDLEEMPVSLTTTLKVSYFEGDYALLVEEWSNKLEKLQELIKEDDDSVEGKRNQKALVKAKSVVNTLENYQRNNQLMKYCKDRRHKLVYIGPTSIDKKSNLDSQRLFEYLEKANIKFI